MEITIEKILNTNLLFYIFCMIAVGSAIYVLFSKNLLYAAYSLLLCFLGVAGIFVFGGAEFVAASQIMIYIGGILVLLIFGIMLSADKKFKKNNLKVESEKPFSILIFVFLAVLAGVLLISSVHFKTENINSEQELKNTGFYLMTNNVLALELVGILLLMALIGATFIAKKHE
jgi:NADH-quinone oxidoreductase subunit J